MRRALAASLVCALALSACGKATRTADAVDLIAGFAQRARDARTFRMAIEGRISGLGQTASFEQTGAYDLERRLGRFTMDLSRVGFGDAVEMVVTPTLLYMEVPSSLPVEIPPGKRWMRFEVPRRFNPLTPSDPARYFDLLAGLASDVTEKGKATVRGVSTTEYGIVVEIDEVVALAPESQRDSVREAYSSLGETIPMRVWLGDDGLVYRVRFAVDIPTGSVTLSMEMFDYGEPVRIEEPPAEEVFDAPEAFGRTFSGG